MKIPSLSVPKSLLGMQDIHLLMSFCSVLQEYAWKEIALGERKIGVLFM
jgi:hypothetical protein